MKRILLCALVAFPALLLSSCNKEMEENVAGLTAEQKEMAATLESLKGTDAELDALIDAVEARIVTLEGKVADLESGVGDLETSVGDLETSVGDLESGVGDLETSVGDLESGVGDLETSIGAMQSEITTLKTSLETLQAMNKKIDATIKELEESIRTSEGQMYEFNNRLAEIEKFTSELEALKGQLEELGVIRADVEALKQSLAELGAADADLNQLLSALTSRADAIEAEIDALKNAGSGGSSGGTDNPSGGSDTPSDNSQVEALETRVAELESELDATNQAINNLTDSVTEVRNTIQSILDTMQGYANKTDLTALETELLAQINTVKSDVTALTNECAEKFGVIETDIETIQQSLISLEEADKNLAGLISALEDRATEIETDIEILVNSVTGSIETVNSRIAELSGELTAVKTAIQDLQAKDSQIDAAIASLNASMETSQQANKNAMEAIEADLAEQLAQIEGLSEILQQHIQTATTTFATQEALSGLSAEIEQLKSDYEARFDLIESEIGGIVAMIQSMTNISPYSDGAVVADFYTDWNGAPSSEKFNLAIMECNYIVRPAGAAEKLASAWAENKDIMQFRAHYTMTRAAFDFVDVEIKDVVAEGDILTVTGYIDGISNAYLNLQESLSASLLVTDGKTDYCTDFVNVVPGNGHTDLSAVESANCYMVLEPGKYRFKAVKGNSGESVGAAESTLYDVQSDPVGTPHSAEVLWELRHGQTTVGQIIEPDVTYRNGYVYFDCPQQEVLGNAVIAVKDSDGKILWSWHIWRLGSLPGYQAYANNSKVLMDCDLGAYVGYSTLHYSNIGQYGLLYQWGRKDPLVATSSLENWASISWPDAVRSDAETGTIEYATSNPTTFIKGNANNKDWHFAEDATIRSDRWYNASASVTKTIYDPCPAGWHVPHMFTWYNSVRATSLEATYYSSDQSVDCTAFSQDGQTLIKYYVYSYRDQDGNYREYSAGYYWGNRCEDYMMIEDIPAPVALKVTSSTISTQEYVYASYGCHVRCAKD